MSTWQIVFICILSLLAVAFVVVIVIRYKKSTFIFAGKKNIKHMTDILRSDKSDEDKWIEITHTFAKGGNPNYSKIYAILWKIWNSNETDEKLRMGAQNILQMKEFYFSLPNKSLAQSVDALWSKINNCADQELRNANIQMLREVKIYCEAINKNNRLDKVITILIDLMEIAGFILTILSIR